MIVFLHNNVDLHSLLLILPLVFCLFAMCFLLTAEIKRRVIVPVVVFFTLAVLCFVGWILTS